MPQARRSRGEENWQLCIAPATAPDQWVAACSTVIDGKTETGERLAGARAKPRLGDKPGAIADFRKALELHPDLPTAREALPKLGVKL
jgi:hypothetical protein